MILAYYGKWIPLEKLRQECGVTRDGSNAENILKAAENFGCVAKGFAGRPVALRKKAKNNFPLILFWEFNLPLTFFSAKIRRRRCLTYPIQ